MIDSRIVRHGETFLLDIGGERLPLYAYLTYQPENGDYEAFREAGVRLFFCTVYAGDRGINQLSGIRPFRPGFWKGYGQYDFTQPDEDFRRIAGKSAPGEIYIIPRLMVEAPSWWDAQNPDELARDAHGTPLHQSFMSQKWLKDVADMMADFQRWLEDSGWDRYVAGWHIAAGNTEEFLLPSHRAGQLTDYSRPATIAFRDWCRMKYYANIARLNRAWKQSLDTFEDVRVPAPVKRLHAVRGDVRDEAWEQQAIDYYTFQNEAVAKAVTHLCAAAKRATRFRQVIGAFYGYVSGGPDSGQHASRIVYTCRDVDFIASPFCYTDNRAPGIDWQLQGAADSAALHGKPWFAEADIRTCLSRPLSQCMPHADPAVSRAYDGPVWWGPDSVEGSLGQMLKAFSRVLTHNNAIWWFDMWGGWYREPRLMAFQRLACDLYRTHALAGGSRSAAEMAVFMDDACFNRMRPGSPLPFEYSHGLFRTLGAVGAPYRLYMADDLTLVSPDDFRMAVFVGLCAWTPEQRTALAAWKGADRVLAFWGPWTDPSVTGVEPLCLPGTEDLIRCQGGHRSQNEDSLYFSDKPERQTVPGPQTPVLRWQELPGDIILASDALGPQALLRRFAGYAVQVDAALYPSADGIRALLNDAGGQLNTCEGDVAYASASHIAVHAASDGVKRIHIPGKGTLTDEMTGDVLPGNESFVDVRMKKGETLLLKLTKTMD